MSKQLSVLLIDDENILREIIAKALELINNEHKYFSSIITAKDGAEGISKAERQDFDLIILDNQMPKVKGLQVIKTLIRAHKSPYKPASFIFMSGTLDEKDVMDAVSLGVRTVLAKPFEDKDFRDRVVKHIKEKLK